MLPDFSALLIPINQENPAGNNLEYEPLFDDIRLKRESDPDYLPEDEWSVSEPRSADWNQVRILCENALREQAKDIQLACWLVEAMSHLHGLTGLYYGTEFLSEFITRFWFQCWPYLDGEEGIKIRRSKILRLDRDLGQELLRRPLLCQPNTSINHWRKILAFEQKINLHPDIRDDLILQDGDMTKDSFFQQAKLYSSMEIGQQAVLVNNIITSIDQLEERYFSLSQDSEGKLFTHTRQVLKEITDYLQRLTQLTTPSENEVMSQDATSEHVLLPSDIPPVSPGPQAMSREKAISQMLAIAGYFRQSEPSSPVPFLMERAARWATMSLTEWLEEMINDKNSINEINNVLTGFSQ